MFPICYFQREDEYEGSLRGGVSVGVYMVKEHVRRLKRKKSDDIRSSKV